MSANGQVIKAAQMFVKQGAGASKSFNLKAEMLYGTTLGIGVGLTWKVSCLTSTVWLLPPEAFLEQLFLLPVTSEGSTVVCRYTTGTRRENKLNTTARSRD